MAASVEKEQEGRGSVQESTDELQKTQRRVQIRIGFTVVLAVATAMLCVLKLTGVVATGWERLAILGGATLVAFSYAVRDRRRAHRMEARWQELQE